MANDFGIEITANDAATAIIEKVNQSLSKMTGNTQKLGKQTNDVAGQARSSLGKLEAAFDKAARSASLVVDKIVQIVPGLAAIGGMAGVGAIGAISDKFANFGMNLSNSARLVGMNTRELAKFEYAARRAGQSSESMVSTISSMQDAIRGAAMGQNPQAMAQMLGWGVNLKRNPDGSVANMNDVVLQVMDKIGAIHSAPAQRYAAGLFGASGSLATIQQGTYRSDMARADRMGLVPTDADIDKGQQLKQKIIDLQSEVDALIVKIGSALMPVVGPLVDKFSQMLSASNGQVAGQIADAVQRIVNWASNVDWAGLISSAKQFFDEIGGLKGIFAAIVAYKVTGVIASLVSFGATIASVGGITAGAVGTVAAAVSGLGLLAAGAAVVINKLKDSTEGGHYVRRGPGAGPAQQHPLPASESNQSWWDRTKAAWNAQGHFVSRADRNAHGTTSGTAPDLTALAQAQSAAQASQAPAAAAETATAPADAAAQAAALPLGVRSNNPLNVSPNGQEAIYASAEDGIAAATYNLRKNYSGLTLDQIADKWTGGARTGNTPQQRANYLSMLTQGTGLGANAVPDLNNQQLVAAMLTRQIQAENGTNNGQAWYTPDQVAAGVARGFGGRPAMVGTSDAGQAQAAATRGGGAITVTFNNVPKGTNVEAKTGDGGWMPTRINYSLSN
jgi:hypothetical protein